MKIKGVIDTGQGAALQLELHHSSALGTPVNVGQVWPLCLLKFRPHFRLLTTEFLPPKQLAPLEVHF